VDLTSDPKTLLSELKRVIGEDDSRNRNIKSFASLFDDNEIFPFRLKNKYRNKDIWQLFIVPKDCERGKQTQSIISVNGKYNELQVHQIGLFLAALISRWRFSLSSVIDKRLRKYMLQTAERMVCNRASIYLNGIRKTKSGRYRSTIAYFDEKKGSSHEFCIAMRMDLEQSSMTLPDLPPNVVFADTQAQQTESPSSLSYPERLFRYLCFSFHGLVTTSEKLRQRIKEMITTFSMPLRSEASKMRPAQAFEHLKLIQKCDELRNDSFCSFSSIFESQTEQSGQKWSISSVYQTNGRYIIQLLASRSAHNHKKQIESYSGSHIQDEEQALHVAGNLVTLLEAWPNEISMNGLKKPLARLATEMTSSSPVHLESVALEQRKCSSKIQYFTRHDESPITLTSEVFKITVSLNDVIEDIKVPGVPSNVLFAHAAERKSRYFTHESAEAQAASKVVQYICWRLDGSIATQEAIQRQVKELLEGFLIQRFPKIFFQYRGCRPAICFTIRYLDTKLKKRKNFVYSMTTMEMSHSESIDDLCHCTYGDSGDPELPLELDAESRLICEKLIPLAKRFCWMWRSFEGTRTKLLEQIKEKQDRYMQRIGLSWHFNKGTSTS